MISVRHHAALLLSALVALCCSGCAIGQHVDYQREVALSSHTAAVPLRVVTIDERRCVVERRCPEDWVGIQRSILGIPYSVHTKSHNSLAGDLAVLLSNSLRNDGADAEFQVLPPGTSEEFAQADASLHRVRTSLVLRIREWESETWWHTSVRYDVELESFAPGGDRLSSDTLRGRLTLEEGNPKHRSVADAAGEILDAILEQPGVQSILSAQRSEGGMQPGCAG